MEAKEILSERKQKGDDGAGEMTQSIKCPGCKRRDLCCNCQHPLKKLGLLGYTVGLEAEEAETGGLLGAHWSANPVKLMSSRFRESSGLQKHCGDAIEEDTGVGR